MAVWQQHYEIWTIQFQTTELHENAFWPLCDLCKLIPYVDIFKFTITWKHGNIVNLRISLLPKINYLFNASPLQESFGKILIQFSFTRSMNLQFKVALNQAIKLVLTS